MKQQNLEKEEDEFFIAILREIYIYSSCEHPNIISIKGVIFDQQNYLISIIFPKYYKDLFQILFGENRETISNKKEICSQLVLGIKYLHEKNFIHLDLKPQNLIFLDQSLKDIVIIDFGISKIQSESNKETDVIGMSGFYCPPEVSLKQKSIVSTNSDIFSLGIVLYEIITGIRAWNKYQNQSGVIYDLIHSKQFEFFKENDSTGNNEIDNLIIDCVNCEPNQRPNANDVLSRINLIEF